MEFLDSIQKKDKAKFFRIFQNLKQYGMETVISHIKMLTGMPFWKILILGKSNSIIIYAVVIEGEVLLLHGFVKKTQKTPLH